MKKIIPVKQHSWIVYILNPIIIVVLRLGEKMDVNWNHVSKVTDLISFLPLI